MMISALWWLAGLLGGWWLRGTVDRYIISAFVKILTSRAGKARMSAWIGDLIAKHDTEASRD